MGSQREPKHDRPHVVIIGGGFGGLNAAKRLGGEAVRVTLVDRANHHLFQPLLYQVAMAGLSPADIAYPIRSVLRKQSNITTLLAEVVGADLEKRTLTLHDGAMLSYDYLIVAAGARTNYFGHDDDWGRHSLALKTIEDALEVRRRVLLAFETAEREPDPAERRRLLTFVIIGGGPTGVEIAGAIRDLARAVLTRDFRVIDPSQTRVIVIEMQERVLPAGFSPELSESAREQLEQLGVEVRTQTRVDGIDALGVTLGKERVDAGTVLWTAGVMARRLTRTLGVELDRQGRIPVGLDLALPDRPEVFAIGDNARFEPAGSAEPLPGLAAVAMQQGAHVADNVLASVSGEAREPFVYVNKGIMATVGRKRAVVQFPKLALRGFVAWLTWLFVHILLLVGFRNRLVVLLNWFWHYVTYRSGARLITGWRSWDWETHGGLNPRAERAVEPRAK
jgi:NADH:ubiquinone reductase (H+-translocating)